jgi:hypothetical protein
MREEYAFTTSIPREFSDLAYRDNRENSAHNSYYHTDEDENSTNLPSQLNRGRGQGRKQGGKLRDIEDGLEAMVPAEALLALGSFVRCSINTNLQR